jgi:hypothetical protein
VVVDQQNVKAAHVGVAHGVHSLGQRLRFSSFGRWKKKGLG